MGFLHEFGAQDQKFCQEQQLELDVLNRFARQRDELLEQIGRAATFQHLAKLSGQVDALMSEAERKAGTFRFFAQRFWSSMQMAQTRISEKLQMSRDRLHSERENQRDLSAMRAEADRREAMQEIRDREHQARLRQTQEETQAIYRQTAKFQQEASDRSHQMWMRGQFPDQFCPCCGGHKLLGHTYCHPCYDRRLDWNH